MIIRNHYRASLKPDVAEDTLREALREDAAVVRESIAKEDCLTVAMYPHGRMLFLYYEAIVKTIKPWQLFPKTSRLLAPWPGKDGSFAPWAYMYHIYYHAVPTTVEQWIRTEKKKRRGRIAYLLPDKLFSYVYYHQAIVSEGLLEGDRYQSIALHEDILFSYFEEPKIFTHIRQESGQESRVIREWTAADPESHFDQSLSGEENFLLLDELFSMGREDIFGYGR